MLFYFLLSICNTGWHSGGARLPVDQIMKKTKTKEDNWAPVWREEFEFPLTVPALALLQVEIQEYDMSKKDDFAGQTCLPASLRVEKRDTCCSPLRSKGRKAELSKASDAF